MRRVLAAAALLALLAPGAAAKTPDYEYPEDLLALVPGWIEEAEALGAPSRNASWHAEAAPWLEKARAAQAEGRLRVAMFHAETYVEIVSARQLLDEVASLPNDAERKARILERTDAWREDAEASWSALRGDLAALDEARGLRTIEAALYAADVGLSGIILLSELDALQREFPSQPTIDAGFVTALVRSSRTAQLDVDWARQIADAAARREGLPPRVLEEPWGNLSRAVLVDPGEVPAVLQAYEARAKPARAEGEVILSLAATLAEQRASRANAIQSIFGDARSRGLDVVNDAARGMRTALNNTTLETPRSRGMDGIFHADAIDRARYTDEILATGNGTLPIVIVAWAGIDHADYVYQPLSRVSPVAPAPEEKPTPGAPIVLLLALAALAALARRR